MDNKLFYKNKYLKYKNKYSKLKINYQSGGNISMLTPRLFGANIGIGYLILPIENSIRVLVPNILDSLKHYRIDISTIMPYNRTNIRGGNERYSSSWSGLYHNYGNELTNETLLEIFHYGLFTWYLHDIFYKMCEFSDIKDRDPRNLPNSILRLIIELKYNDQKKFKDIIENLAIYNTIDSFFLLAYSINGSIRSYLRKKNYDKELIETRSSGKDIVCDILFILGQLAENIFNNTKLQKLGCVFQRLKIVEEKIENKSSENYINLNILLNNIQTMIYNHMDIIYTKIKEELYDNIIIGEKKFLFKPYDENKLAQISVSDPSFYEEKKYQQILSFINTIEIVPNESVQSFQVPPYVISE